MFDERGKGRAASLRIRWAVVTAALLASSAASPAADPPTTQPHGNVVAFQPGVTINWRQRQVEVAATVILREGPIELLACSPRIREHESIVRIEARPYHVYQALGLIGLTPGHPVRWDKAAKKLIPPTGEAVEVLIRYQRGRRAVTVNAWEWLARADGQALEAKPPWVFAGSLTGEDGSFAADFEGTVVAIVDFPTALLAVPELHTSDNSELWLAPNTRNIPAEGTPCTLLFRPAAGAAPALVLRMDRFSRVTAGRGLSEGNDIQALVTDYVRSTNKPRVMLIVSPMAARADVERFVARLKSWGVPPEYLVVREDSSSSVLPHDAEALHALLGGEVEFHRRLMAGVSRQHKLLSERIRRGDRTIRAAVRAGGELLHQVLSRTATTFRPDAGKPETSRPLPAAATGARP